MSKVIYVHPINHQSSFTIPMGIIAVMNQIKYPKQGYYSYEITQGILAEVEILLLDLHWYHSLWAVTQLCNQYKKINPRIKVILGGFTATIYAKILVSRFSIDFVVKGDGEMSLPQLIEGLIENRQVRNIPGVVATDWEGQEYRPADNIKIDELDYYTIDWFPQFQKRVVFECQQDIFQIGDESFWPIVPVNRGCPFDCDFCYGSQENTQLLFGRGPIHRSKEKITEDLKMLQKMVWIKNVFLVGDFINLLREDDWRFILNNKYNLDLYYEFYNLPSIEALSRLICSFNRLYLTFSLYHNHGEGATRVNFNTLKEIVEFLKGQSNLIFKIFTHHLDERVPEFVKPYLASNNGWRVQQPDPALLAKEAEQKKEFSYFYNLSREQCGDQKTLIQQCLSNQLLSNNVYLISSNDLSFEGEHVAQQIRIRKTIFLGYEEYEVGLHNDPQIGNTFPVKFKIIIAKEFFEKRVTLESDRDYLVRFESKEDLQALLIYSLTYYNHSKIILTKEELESMVAVTFADLCRFSPEHCQGKSGSRQIYEAGEVRACFSLPVQSNPIDQEACETCLQFKTCSQCQNPIDTTLFCQMQNEPSVWRLVTITQLVQRILKNEFFSIDDRIEVIVTNFLKHLNLPMGVKRQICFSEDLIIFCQGNRVIIYSREKNSFFETTRGVVQDAYNLCSGRTLEEPQITEKYVQRILLVSQLLFEEF